MIRVRTIVAILLLTIIPALASAELDTGLRKMKQEQDKVALTELEKKADTANDYLELARRYRQGIGTAPDMKKSMEWLRKAAEKGNINAQFSLGYLYLSGTGGPRSMSKALEWLTKAANSGHANAQFYLGSICESGEGLRAPDKVKAASWYTMAAERGHSEAQFRLAMLYQAGTGVVKNETEAKRWLKASAANGNVLAKSELERIEPTQRGNKPTVAPPAAKPVIIIPGK